jgi:Zn-dependent M28 family amino/carboxypeptidase
LPDAEHNSRGWPRSARSGDAGTRLHADGEYTSQNVIGEINGRSKPVVVVIGGHLDSWDLGTGAID